MEEKLMNVKTMFELVIHYRNGSIVRLPCLNFQVILGRIFRKRIRKIVTVGLPGLSVPVILSTKGIQAVTYHAVGQIDSEGRFIQPSPQSSGESEHNGDEQMKQQGIQQK